MSGQQIPRPYLPSGPEFLFNCVRVRVHRSISDAAIRAVLVPALSELAMLARQNEIDSRDADVDTAPQTWQGVCDWLVSIVGRFSRFPERESL